MKKSVMLMVVLGLPLVAAAADKSPDQSFYEDAAQGNLSEIEQGQLAQSKSQNQAVKDFGAMMIKDHGAANDKLRALASRKGIELPSSSGTSNMAARTRLEMLSGDSFDKSYIKGMVKDHKDDIAAFQKEEQSGQDADARGFAKSTLPTLEKHLKAIQGIAKRAGVDAD